MLIMRIQKIAFLGTFIFVVGCMVLYFMLESRTFPLDTQITSQELLQVADSDKGFAMPGNGEAAKPFNKSKRLPIKLLASVFNAVKCDSSKRSTHNVDIQMASIYDLLKFDNIEGGAWKQGWNIAYDSMQWSPQKKLKVFVVPHSHNDPGWKKTFEDYYTTQTRSILNNMVVKLSADIRRKFIWAEISFFSLWWKEISEETKLIVKNLISNGQLEIVTGGWVMNDEANTHYYSMLTQLTHGHQWLQKNLNIKPRFSWSIDPFGLSPTMPFLLKKSGFEGLVIQRVHYSVKKQLAREKQLEFNWRQIWDNAGRTSLLTHMMPFYSYDVPHTCGPDPKICCQFDFERLPGSSKVCPWKVAPQVITDNNVAYRAETLVDQYRKKAQLYGTDALLVPLGDDFRYMHASNWDDQFNNYQKLFDYINSSPSLNVQAQFGTLSDYFDALSAEKPAEGFPSLSGDFFTYADRDDHYWSGYYTSRPFYKRMDRVLVAYLRNAELLFTLSWMSGGYFLTDQRVGLTKLLDQARASLSLFQHHDGITGTAKDHVVNDYAEKLMDAIKAAQHVIQNVAKYLLSPDKLALSHNVEMTYFSLDDTRAHPYSLPEQLILTLGPGFERRRLVLFNPLARQRSEVVSIRVTMHNLKVVDGSGSTVPSQVSPLCHLASRISDAVSSECLQLSFVAHVPPLSLTTYFVEETPTDDVPSMVAVQLFNAPSASDEYLADWPGIIVEPVGKEFSVQNKWLSASFGELGLLKAVTMKDSRTTIPLHLSFLRYTARPSKEMSGAYLFLPNGEGETIKVERPVTLVMEGAVMSQVIVFLPHIVHRVILYNTPGADGHSLEIQNLVDISGIKTNYELSMRLSSDIKNDDIFFTDLNSFQVIRRKRLAKLPLQANFYPMPSSAYIEDGTNRLTLLSAQPLGVASLKEGQLEVMQDRRLLQDDNLGLGQGVLDNIPTITAFRLALETMQPDCKAAGREGPGGRLSTDCQLSLHSLSHPLIHMLLISPVTQLLPNFRAARSPLPADIHLLALTTLPPSPDDTRPSGAGLLLHRLDCEPCFNAQRNPSNDTLTVAQIFPPTAPDKMFPSSLTFLHIDLQTELSTAAVQHVCPNDIVAFWLPSFSSHPSSSPQEPAALHSLDDFVKNSR